MNENVAELVKRFPAQYIKEKAGHAYVEHALITQRIIEVFGVPPKIEVLRELYDDAKLTGVVMRLTLPGLEPVEEAGECDNPQSKTNGARAKDACSDAIKRCAMRLGLGLHLWAQENYYLDTLNVEGGGSPVSEERAANEPLVNPPSSQSSPGEPASQDSPQPVSPSPGDTPWFAEYVDKYGADSFCKAATKFAKGTNAVTDPAVTSAATQEQRDAIIAELTANDWNAPVTA